MGAIRSLSAAGTTDAQERVCCGSNEKPGASKACNGEGQDEGQELAYNIVFYSSDTGEKPAAPPSPHSCPSSANIILHLCL